MSDVGLLDNNVRRQDKWKAHYQRRTDVRPGPECRLPAPELLSLSLWSWQTVVKAVFLDRVDIVSEYERSIRSPSFELKLPSVIALKKYIKPATYPAFTRFNLFLRDRFTCQYCGQAHTSRNNHELTFDHVIPRVDGGRTTWENVAAACSPCNLRKGGRTPAEAHMELQSQPYRPTVHQLQANGRFFPPNYMHESWRDYLYWDSVLEP